jgi:hypothetical protein
MASEPDQHSSPASFYESPQAARQARPEEFLYLACMHEGTGVDEPDILAVVDAQDGRGAAGRSRRKQQHQVLGADSPLATELDTVACHGPQPLRERAKSGRRPTATTR